MPSSVLSCSVFCFVLSIKIPIKISKNKQRCQVEHILQATSMQKDKRRQNNNNKKRLNPCKAKFRQLNDEAKCARSNRNHWIIINCDVAFADKPLKHSYQQQQASSSLGQIQSSDINRVSLKVFLYVFCFF